MTHPITSTSEVTDVTVAYDRMTDALAAARQLAMPPGALEEICALICGAFDDDIRFRVPIAYARSAAAAMVARASEGRLRNDRLKTALDTFCAAAIRATTPMVEQAEAQADTTQPIPPQSPRRQHGPHKPTPAYLAALASKPGIARVEMLPNGTVVAVPGEPSANNIEANPWDEVLINAADQKRPS
jgi:hypothetical protein